MPLVKNGNNQFNKTATRKAASGYPSSKSLEITIFLLIFLLSGIYFISFCHVDMNIWDEGVPLSGIQRMKAGERPIRDFIAYPPGRYLLYWLSTEMGGMRVRSPRVMMAVFTGFAAAIIWLIGRRAGLKRRAVIPVLCYLLMPMYYYYRFFTFMLLLMVLSLDLQLRNKNCRQMILSGLLGAIVVWFRLILGIFIMVLLPLAALIHPNHRDASSKIRKWTPTLITFAGFFLQIIYIGGFGVWLKYLETCLSFTRAGLSDMSLPWPPLWSPSYLSGMPYSYIFQDVMIYLSVIILLIFTIKMCGNRRTVSPTLFALCIVGWIGFGLVIWRTGYGNLLRASPPLTIMAVWLIPRGTKRTPLILSAGWLVFAGLAVDSLYMDPQTYQSIGVYRMCPARFQHPRFSVRMRPGDCFMMSRLVSSLENASAGQSTHLLALPFHTIFNFITGYSATPYFDWLLPGNFENRELYQEMIQETVNSSPDLVLLNDDPFDGYPERRFSYQYPELILWLMRDYFRWYQVGSFKIMRKKPPETISLLSGGQQYLESVTGTTEMRDVMIGGKKIRLLVQKGDASYTVSVEPFSAAVFSAGVVLDAGTDSGSQCEMAVTVNGNLLGTGRISADNLYMDISARIPPSDSQNCRIELSVDASMLADDDAVIWIEPSIFEGYPETAVVDRYCISF